MFYDPVQEGFFEADVMTDFLALNPLVAEDFLAFCEEFLVEERLLHEVVLFVSREAHCGTALSGFMTGRQRFG
jgi:hypothetical protein